MEVYQLHTRFGFVAGVLLDGVLEFHFLEGCDEFAVLVLFVWAEGETHAGGELFLVVEG